MSREHLVLAIETTAPLPGVALARTTGGDVLVIAEEHTNETGRAENLSACIRTALETAGARAADVTALAVVDGPGSYTALRIGLALARGMAIADRLPTAVCGSLELIAETCAPRNRICALLDASQGKLYAAGFEREGHGLRESHGAVIVPAADLSQELERWGGQWVCCADTRLAQYVALEAVAPVRRAAVWARIGALRVIEGECRAADDVLPRYVGATGARLPASNGAHGDRVSI